MASPLADRVRPQCLDDVAGQSHLLAPGKALRSIVESGNTPNMIFYGPSGVGKTTVANIIAKQSGKKLYHLNATTASSADIKAVIADIGALDAAGGILLYLDEIQYFNRRQQQTLLEFIENGDISLIASTAENPYFYVYSAIISRSTVFEFKSLTAEDVKKALLRAADFLSEEQGIKVELTEEAADELSCATGGDVRRALNVLELAFFAESQSLDAEKAVIGAERVRELCNKSSMRYSREGDDFYDVLSAYHKSMRGSDPDAALHYLARILEAGDLPSACRRLLCAACEDVGLAYPQIIPIVKAAIDSALFLGLPEGRLPLADAVVMVCLAPKSNSAYMGIAAAMEDIEKGNIGPIPRQLQNKHFDGADAKVKGQNYLYPHDFPNHWVAQQYLPDVLKGRKYYEFGDNKTEQAYREYQKKIRNEK
ncbi:MAG: replication-associated recombination protein A [Clostridia bacterium]|nr:replication-associated recombination protein A [Clostridia bacterium]